MASHLGNLLRRRVEKELRKEQRSAKTDSDRETARPRDTSAAVADAQKRLGDLPGLKRRIGIIRLWPDQAVAEHENVERIRAAAALIGVEVIELDRNGYILGAPHAMVSRNDVDFVLHLHFETPKAYDVPSIAAMWNPIDFYFDWGFDRYWANQMSHDMFAWTGSEEVSAMIAKERGDDVAQAMPLFNHTLSEPVFEPRARRTLEIFYCGINWERISGKPGRHDGVLRALDEAGRLALYGPELVQGVNVWEGYKSYRGGLPFDGRTVIERISQAGACLVFSSDAHKSSGIMSNRLFEAMSGGAVVIGDEHPFIAQAIGDNYIKVPSSLPTDERVRLILDALDELENDPSAALDMASKAQDLFIKNYFLCAQLVNLFESYCQFQTRSERTIASATSPLVDVIVQPIGQSGDKIVERLSGLSKGLGDHANIIVLCTPTHEKWLRQYCGAYAQIVGALVNERDVLAPADAARAVQSHLVTGKLWFTTLIEEVFYTQFFEAVTAFAGHAVGRLGHLLRHFDQRGEIHFDYCSGDAPVERFHEAARGALIFDTKWLLDAVRPNQIGWRDCLRMAEFFEGGIVFDQPAALSIHLSTYEKMTELGYREKSLINGAQYGLRGGVKRKHISQTSSFKHSPVTLIDYNISRDPIVFNIDNLRTAFPILGEGWHSLEPGHVWSSGTSADLWLKARPEVKALRLLIEGNPHVAGGVQTIEVLVNGRAVAQCVAKDGQQLAVEFDTTSDPWVLDHLNQVTLIASAAASPPVSTGDKRTLGVILRSVEIA